MKTRRNFAFFMLAFSVATTAANLAVGGFIMAALTAACSLYWGVQLREAQTTLDMERLARAEEIKAKTHLKRVP